MLKISGFVICIGVIIYLLLGNLHDCTFKYDVVLTAIYGYHTGRTYEFTEPHICPQYVSITVW